MTMELSQDTREAVRRMAEADKEFLPDQLGIDHFITGCPVVNLDPYGVGVGVTPRYVQVALRGEYYQDVYYRGGILGLAVGTELTVVHLSEGDRYEVSGPSGAGGVIAAGYPPRQWLAENGGFADFEPDNPAVVTAAGVVTEYATIVAAIAAAGAGEYVVIPPGTYNENITLKADVKIVELFTGTVHIIATGGTSTVTCADDGYINVCEIGMNRTTSGGGVTYAIDAAAAPSAGNECTIIAEVLSANNNESNTGAYPTLIGVSGCAGTLYVSAKRAWANNARGGGRYIYGINSPSTGILNVNIDYVDLHGNFSYYPINVTSSSGFTINLWGGYVYIDKDTWNTFYAAIVTNGVDINLYHQTWYVYNSIGAVWFMRPTGTYSVTINAYHTDVIVISDTNTADGVDILNGVQNVTVNFRNFSMYVTASTTGIGFEVDDANSVIRLWHGDVNATTTDLVQTAGLLQVNAVRHYTSSGAISFIGHTGVNNFTVGAGAITILPGGAGDVTAILTVLYAVSESAGGTSGGTATCTPGASVNLYADGVDTLALAVGAGGDVTLQRTAGAATFDVSLQMVWI